MPQYKITYEDRSLTSWKINEYNTLEYVELVDFCPVQNRLLHGDVFHYDSDTKKVDVTHSCIRNAASMPGVLILENNKMYRAIAKNPLKILLMEEKFKNFIEYFSIEIK